MKIVMQIIYSIGIILFILLFNFNNVYAQQIVDDKKWISGQTTSYYNAGGYSGSLSSYIYSGSYTPSDTIWISGQTTSYYNASGYSGSLSSYVYSGSYTPSESKNANYTCYNTLVYVYNSEGKRLASPDYQNQLCPSSESYNDAQGYSGTLYRISASPNRYCAKTGFPNASCSENWTAKYSGIVTKPGNDTRVYRYEGFVTKPTSDTRVYRYQGWVYAVVNNPTNSGQASSTGNGKASGQFIWQLNKQNANAPSRVQLRNTAGIAGSHFATRNSIYQINSPSVISKTSTAPQNYYVNDPHDLRDKNINYAFAYDYTNYYRDVYTCSSSRSDGCIQWTYSHREPDWTYQETATFNKTMKGDHKYQDQQEIVYPTNNISLIVGRTTNLSNMNESYQQEHFNVDNSTITKETQTWIEINEPVTYRSDLGNPLYSLTDELWYFPNEIDENLEEQYKNTTSFTYSDIAIPLRVNMKNNSSINYKTEDNFFVTKNNGLLFSLPHTQVSILAINKKAKEEYEDFTGETYEDEVLNSPFNGSRYYFNINGNSEQEPNIQYSNDYIVGELGLSDATLHIGENLEFEKYLLGNPIDDPVINEQPGSKVLNANYDNSITIKSNQISDLKDISNDRNFLIHGFRSTDIYKKYNQVKNILPSLSY